MQIKKVLVTGAAGFIGSHLVEKCVESGYKVRAFIRYNSRNNWGWLEGLKCIRDIEIIAGDIRDFDSVYNALGGCDTVFHLAALIGIPYSYVSPLAYIRTNIEGTYNVLQSAKLLKTRNIIITSTSETYGTAQYVPIDEMHPLVGQSPYSASKISADQLALSFFTSFDLPVKIARPFNTFGPRQSARAIIPTIIIQLLSGEKNLRLGSLFPSRDFTFVKDTVNAFIEIARSERLWGEVVNIGTKSEVTVRELVDIIAGLLKQKANVVNEDTRIRPDKSEVERLICDNTKIIKLTNWKPKYSLEQGLKETVSWFKAKTHLYKGHIYNI